MGEIQLYVSDLLFRYIIEGILPKTVRLMPIRTIPGAIFINVHNLTRKGRCATLIVNDSSIFDPTETKKIHQRSINERIIGIIIHIFGVKLNLQFVTYRACGVGLPVILQGNVTFKIPGLPKTYLQTKRAVFVYIIIIIKCFKIHAFVFMCREI